MRNILELDFIAQLIRIATQLRRQRLAVLNRILDLALAVDGGILLSITRLCVQVLAAQARLAAADRKCEAKKVRRLGSASGVLRTRGRRAQRRRAHRSIGASVRARRVAPGVCLSNGSTSIYK